MTQWIIGTATKCTRQLGRGGEQWNDERGATTHALIAGGVTLCGVRVGSIERGWLTGTDYRFRVRSAADVTCRKCARILT